MKRKMRNKRPVRKAYNKRRKSFKRRSTSGLSVRRLPGIVPDKLMVKLYSSANFSMGSSSGAINTISYRPNNLYDIQTAIGGPYVNGYSEWSALYSHNRVRGFAFVWNIIPNPNTTSAGSIDWSVVVCPGDQYGTVTAFTDINQMRDQRIGKRGFATTFQSPPKVKMYISTNKVFGLTRQQYDDEADYSAIYGTNLGGSATAYTVFAVQSADKATTVNWQHTVRYTHYVEFFNPVNTYS